MTTYNYKQTLLIPPRTILGTGDNITITATAESFVSNGSTLSPTSITFNAVLTGIFAGAPVSNITWTKNAVAFSPARTGANMTLTAAESGLSALANGGSVNITATISHASTTKSATKTITLTVPTAVGQVTPLSAVVTTAPDGTGAFTQNFTLNITSGSADASSGWAYSWSAPGMTLTPSTITTKTVLVTGMTGDSGTITCTATKLGYLNIVASATLSKSKTGTPGRRTAVLDMYKWLATVPNTFPIGTSTYTWAQGTFTDPVPPPTPTAPATHLNGWLRVPSASVPGQTLYIVRQIYLDLDNTTTLNVVWAATSCFPIGGAGENGRRTGYLELYKWATGSAPIVTFNATDGGVTSTYTWSNGTFTIPGDATGWSIAPGTPTAGATLWAISTIVTDTGTDATSTATWVTQTAKAVGGLGANGQDGNSAVIVYRRDNVVPGKPTSATNPPTLPEKWYSTVALAKAATDSVSTDPMYMSTGLSTNGTTWTWNDPMLMNGQPGTPGANGKLFTQGYVYYNTALPTNPGTPLATLYTLSTGTFLNLTSGWSLTPPTATASNSKYWAARFNAMENSPDSNLSSGANLVFSVAFNSINFNGLVTFTNIIDTINDTADSGITTIDGGRITAGTLILQTNNTGNRIVLGRNSDTTAPNTITGYDSGGGIMYRLATSSLYSSGDAVMYVGLLGGTNYSIIGTLCIAAASGLGLTFKTGYLAPPSSINAGVYGANGGLGAGVEGILLYGFGGQFSGAGGVYALAGSYGATGVEAHGGSGGQGVYSAGIGGGNAFYGILGNGALVAGAWYPFTGAHEVLVSQDLIAVEGDILIDTSILVHKDVSNTLLIASISNTQNQKGAIGILTGIFKSFTIEDMPCNLGETGHPFGPELVLYKIKDPMLYAYYSNYYLNNNTYMSIQNNYRTGSVNSLGEGQINVCGEGGDLEVGDLIVTSSLPGKGMKQADDIVRSYTVAKCRENVTFSSPTEVKMVACIYLCG